MRIKSILAKSLIAVGICLSVIVVAILTLPLVLDRETVRNEATKRLSAWAGGQIDIGGPVKISYFPDVSLEASNIWIQKLKPFHEIEELSAKRLRVRLSWFPLLLGKIEIAELTLNEPQIIATSASLLSTKRSESETLSFPTIFNLLGRSSVGRFLIRDGSLKIVKENYKVENIKNIHAELSVPGDGILSGKGTLQWRSKELKFSITTGRPHTVSKTGNVPLRLSLMSSLLNADLSGELTFADGFQLMGDLDLKGSSVRDLSNWFGHALSPGRGLGEFSASGKFTWHRKKIAFEQGHFMLDGNSADGALSLDWEGFKPLIDGTLASNQLVISQYLEPQVWEKSSSVRPSIMNQSINLSLLNEFDADLRISTGRMEIGDSLSSGRCAFTASLKSGRLLVDFTELEIFEGTAMGHAEINSAAPLTKFVFSASLSNVMAEKLLYAISAKSLLQGPADIKIDITSEGRTPEHLLRAAGGKFKIDMNNGGQASIDLSELLNDVKASASTGWGRATLGQTTLEKLNMSMDIKNGHARTRNFYIKTSNGVVTGGGAVDIGSLLMDWQLIITGLNGTSPKIGAATGISRNSKLIIRGPWAQPLIQLENGRNSNSGMAPPAPTKVTPISPNLPLDKLTRDGKSPS